MGNEVNGTVQSASDLKGPEDSKGLEKKDDKGVNDTGASGNSKVDDVENANLDYREKPKYVSLEKHKKILKQRNEARKELEKAKANKELEDISIDSAAIEKLADKMGLDPEASREFANLIFKSGVETATKVIKAKYGDDIKKISVATKNAKLMEGFESDFNNNLLSVLSPEDQRLAQSHKSEIMKLAFLSENLKTPLYNLFVKNIKSNNPNDTIPPEGAKTGGGRSGERKLEDMSIEEQNALSDEEWERLDKERIKRMKG